MVCKILPVEEPYASLQYYAVLIPCNQYQQLLPSLILCGRWALKEKYWRRQSQGRECSSYSYSSFKAPLKMPFPHEIFLLPQADIFSFTFFSPLNQVLRIIHLFKCPEFNSIWSRKSPQYCSTNRDDEKCTIMFVKTLTSENHLLRWFSFSLNQTKPTELDHIPK